MRPERKRRRKTNCLVLELGADGLLNARVSSEIDGCGSLVEHDDLGVLDECTGEGNERAFSDGTEGEKASQPRNNAGRSDIMYRLDPSSSTTVSRVKRLPVGVGAEDVEGRPSGATSVGRPGGA
jgi:hypothetical protein